ncbi:MAG TPA: MCE family protein, partial [Candidatus Coprenecus pullistercoris]|nr:MCE family protein [Candidatus Coprenecus pullistercoris]
MKKEVRIGVFALIIIAASLIMFEFLRGKDIFSRNSTYHIIYESVDGLGVSTAVTVGGFQAGSVTGIAYNRDTRDYTVTVGISRQFDIPEDSRMEVYSSDLLGTKKIRVVLGCSDISAASGDTLEGGFEADMLTSIAGSIGPVLTRLDTLVSGLNTTVASVNAILNEESRSDIRQAIARINRSAGELSSLLGALNESTPEINGIIGRLHSISMNVDSASASFTASAGNVETLTASLAEARIGETVDSLRSLVLKLQSPDGTVGRLLNDDSLYNAVTALACDLDSLVNGIKKDPK